jgi:hypothetical protein
MTRTDKLDLYKQHRDEYAAPKEPALVKVEKARYLAARGKGPPGGELFQDRIGALYAVAYTVKMTRKFAGRGDYAVAKLEAEWWAEAEGGDLQAAPQEEWEWRLLIRTPDFIEPADLVGAREALAKRGKDAGAKEVKLESLAEGLCVQMLHVGPYDQERRTIQRMREFAEAEGYEFKGPHHEIYLSDPRRVEPERLRTILRMPLRRKKR